MSHGENYKQLREIAQSLTPEQSEFVKSKRLGASYPPDRWLEFLKRLSDYDRLGDTVRKQLFNRTILGFVLGIIGVIAGIPLLATGIGVIVLPIGVLTLIWAIYTLILSIRASKQDLPNILREFIVPQVSILREDMAEGAPLELELDLRGAELAEKKASEQQLAGGTFSYPKVVQTVFEDPWMKGSVTLADGSTLTWQISDQLRKRKVTKRNPRGKIKTKYKFKTKRNVEIRLGAPQATYSPVEAAVPASGTQDRVGLKQGDKRTVIKLRRTLVSNTKEAEIQVDDFVDLIAGAYRRIGRAGAEGAKA